MMQLKILGVMGLGGAGFMGLDYVDTSINYQQVPAKITKVTTDCSIKKGKKKIVHRDTDDLLYMPCAYAPAVAAKHGMPKSAVRVRNRVEFVYRSPADDSIQNGKTTVSGKSRDIRIGTPLPSNAHTSDAASYKTRWAG